MLPKVGARLGSTVCDTEVIVVRAPTDDVDLTCGGAPMAPIPAERTGAVVADSDGTLVGKRYEHIETGLEVLCTKPGAGRLRVGAEDLPVKAAKSLPSSD